MECHEGATMIKTFRGLLADGVQDTIVLHTNDGSMGYRLKKFEVITEKPGQANVEATVTISKVSFTPLNTIDLSNNTILGVAFYSGNSSAHIYPTSQVMIFDQEVFNQDIYVGNNDLQGEAMNYYIELELIKLDLNENTVATLKNIKNEATTIL